MNEVFETLGWEGSNWMQAGDEIRARLPVITSLGRYMENGVLTDTLSPEGEEALQRFKVMEYYLMEQFQY